MGTTAHSLDAFSIAGMSKKSLISIANQDNIRLLFFQFRDHNSFKPLLIVHFSAQDYGMITHCAYIFSRTRDNYTHQLDITVLLSLGYIKILSNISEVYSLAYGALKNKYSFIKGAEKYKNFARKIKFLQFKDQIMISSVIFDPVTILR